MSDINEMNEGLRWYVVHTYSGYENRVMANIEKIVENRGLSDLIAEVRIPTETIVETDGGSEKEIEDVCVALALAFCQVVSVAAFNIGDEVDIVDGVMAGFSGVLSEISPEGSEVTVTVPMAGRDMPVKLDMKNIRKKAAQ